MKVIAIDIETETGGEKGLDPSKGPISAIGLYGKEVEEAFMGQEVDVLESVEKYISSLTPGTLLVGWNSSVFDIPWIYDRMKRNNIPTTLRIEYDPTLWVKYSPTPGYSGGYQAMWGHCAHTDLFQKLHLDGVELPKGGLKSYARQELGVEPIEVDRTKMEVLTEEELRNYVLSDVEITYKLCINKCHWS